jgi:prepilin-type N-terminal cleavage/methylation domain-containing protein
MKRARTAGFTLLEVAVAVAILGAGIVTCLQIFAGSLRLQDSASRRTRAVLHARATMDALLFQPEITDHSEERDTAEGFHTKIFIRHATVDEGGTADEEFASDQGLRYLQVDVTWHEAGGEKTYTLKSLRVAPEND